MQNTQHNHAIIYQRIKDAVRKSGEIHAADVVKTNRIKQRLVRQMAQTVTIFSHKSSTESCLLPLIPLGSIGDIALNERMKGDF